MSTDYPTWAEDFKKLKDTKHPEDSAIDDVVRYYKKAMAQDDRVRRDAWVHLSGFRKLPGDGNDRGEQKIERMLLDVGKGKRVELVRPGRRPLPITFTDHNFALTKSRRGQVICDAFGFLEHRKKCHPLTVEVKVKANNPWFAAVESLIQVRLARYNVDEIERWAKKKRLPEPEMTQARGTWGLVVAPQAYFSKDKALLGVTLRLIQRLRKMRAPIIMASSDRLAEGQLDWVDGSYWPS